MRETRSIRLAILFIALFAAAARLRPVIDPDAPWHLFWGARVLEQGARSMIDDAQFTAAGRVFDNIQWLGEAVLLLFRRFFGFAGLSVFCATCAFASTWSYALLAFRTAGRSWRAVPVVALAAAASSFAFEARPQCLMLIMVPLAIAWSIDFAEGRRGSAAKLAALDVVWSQTHGSFVLLPAIVFIALAGWIPAKGPSAFVRRLPFIALLGLAVFIAPAGLEHLRLVRAHSATDAAHYIQELRGLDPFELYPKHVNAFLWLDALLAMGAIRGLWRRGARLDDLAYFVLGAAMTFTARRFRSLWAIFAAPLAGRAGDEGGGPPPHPARERTIGILAMVLVLPLQIQAASASDPERGFGLGLDRDAYAFDAADVLERAGAEGNLFNEYDDGGWLELRLSPRIKIAIDGRTPTFFDEELFFRIRRAAVEGKEALRRFDGEHPFDLVLLKRSRQSCAGLARDPSWRPAYLDRSRALFVKRSATALAEKLPSPAALDPCQPELSIARACADPETMGAIEADLSALLEATPGAPYLHLLKARLVLACRTRPPSEAVEEVDRALALGTRRHEAYQLLGEAKATAGDGRGALEALDLALAYGAGSHALAMRGALKLDTQDPEGACLDFERVEEELHDDMQPAVRFNYARALWASGKPARARIEAGRAAFSGAPGAEAWLRAHAQ